jgi:hypothetical protein
MNPYAGYGGAAERASMSGQPGTPPARRDVGFALDSLLEEGGFEPLVPPLSQHNRGTGPMSPTASIRVGLVIPVAYSISLTVASGTGGSNPPSSSGESRGNGASILPEAGRGWGGREGARGVRGCIYLFQPARAGFWEKGLTLVNKPEPSAGSRLSDDRRRPAQRRPRSWPRPWLRGVGLLIE